MAFRLEAAGLLGWVAPEIDVFYGADNPVLASYEGLSELRDRSGKNLRAVITFDLAERRAADASEFAAATHAALAPCRG